MKCLVIYAFLLCFALLFCCCCCFFVIVFTFVFTQASCFGYASSKHGCYLSTKRKQVSDRPAQTPRGFWWSPRMIALELDY